LKPAPLWLLVNPLIRILIVKVNFECEKVADLVEIRGFQERVVLVIVDCINYLMLLGFGVNLR
jgi:hypothetical protein